VKQAAWLSVHVWCRVAEYLDVDERQNDYDDRPPVLMTREVLAKFRTMEAEHEEASKQQLPRQQRQVCVDATCCSVSCALTKGQLS